MHSLKNTAVAVILLGISFGLYQISLSPKPEIDPSLIPSLDISQGISQNISELGQSSPAPQLPATEKKDLAGGFSATPKLEAPPLPPMASKAVTPSTLDPQRQPLESTTKNNVQSIKYPVGSRVASANQMENDFANHLSGQSAATQISQRELVDSERDAGLVEALKSQTKFDANSAKSDNSFAASGTAQTIGTAKSADDFDATQLVNVDTNPKNLASDFNASSATGNHFDSAVKHAHPDSGLDDLNFTTVWPKVDELVAAGEFRTALQLLSRFYRDDNLTGPQRQRLVGWLDALAGKVIFSDEDQLEPVSYTVGADESLTDIAAKWNVPAQLIYNVNKSVLPNPVAPAMGTKLKQIPGPFTAEIKLDADVLTLFLGDLYAGRFPIRIGISGEPKPGSFEVMMKSVTGHTWRDSNGTDYAPGSPENGYGPHWMGLTGSLCIHAVPDGTETGHNGCIGLSKKDAEDVFGILSEGSQLTIVP